MMMLVDISQGATVPTHTHVNEQAGRVISGSFKLVIDGKEHTLKEGDHYLIPSNVPHSAHGNSSNSLALDIFFCIINKRGLQLFNYFFFLFPRKYHLFLQEQLEIP